LRQLQRAAPQQGRQARRRSRRVRRWHGGAEIDARPHARPSVAVLAAAGNRADSADRRPLSLPRGADAEHVPRRGQPRTDARVTPRDRRAAAPDRRAAVDPTRYPYQPDAEEIAALLRLIAG